MVQALTEIQTLLKGYQAGEVISSNHRRIIYHATSEGSRKPVIIRAYRTAAVSVAELEGFFRDLETAHLPALSSTTLASRHYSTPGWEFKVSHDVQAISLNRLRRACELDLTNWLMIALDAAQQLDQVHRAGRIHCALSPHHILWSQQQHRAYLIDFSRSRKLDDKSEPQGLPFGDLAYQAPELSGRTVCGVDVRSDLYSLGIVLYELLTGQLPLNGSDALAWIHAHFAHIPPSASTLRSDVPQIIGGILMKLIEKDPGQRYQTAAGLMFDLAACRSQWLASGTITPFPIGTLDSAVHLSSCQSFIGRENELQLLRQGWQIAARDGAAVVVVSGGAGVGKSSLIETFREQYIPEHALYGSAKLDQAQNAAPYAAIAQALGMMVRRILQLPEAQLYSYRHRLMLALGQQAQIIADVIPELALIMPTGTPVGSVPQEHSQTRFRYLFKQFTAVLSNGTAPLIIFYDDVQWIDQASLSLTADLLTVAPMVPLLLILSHRAQPPSPELQAFHAQLANTAPRLHIELTALPQADVQRMLEQCLQSNALDLPELSSLCFAKTQGNPFFVKQFLDDMAQRGALHFDTTHRQWRWDASVLREAPLSENVVELVGTLIHRLPADMQRVLQLAAAIGNRFALDVLAAALKSSAESVLCQLRVAERLKLVIPLAAAPQQREQPEMFSFSHDRIQQACYELASGTKQALGHQLLARILIAREMPDEHSDHIFAVTHHLNLASERMPPASPAELIDLNMVAARRAMSAAAHSTALKHIQIALQQTPSGPGAARHTTALLLAQAQAALLCKDFALCQTTLSQLLDGPPMVADRIQAQQLVIDLYIAQERYEDAIRFALTVLTELGENFPRQPSHWDIRCAFLRTRWSLLGCRRRDLCTLAAASETIPIAIISILQKIGPSALYVAPNYQPLFVLRAIQLSIQHGSTPHTAAFFAVLGMLLVTQGKLRAAEHYIQISLHLRDAPITGAFRGRPTYIAHGLVLPWLRPWQTLLPELERNFRQGIEVGDTEVIINAARTHAFLSFYCGASLSTLEPRTERYLEVISSQRRRSSRDSLRMLLQTIRLLSGRDDGGSSGLSGSVLSAEQFQHFVDGYGRDLFLGIHSNLLVGIVHYHLGIREIAQHRLQTAVTLAARLPGYVGGAVALWYLCLTKTSLAQMLSSPSRLEHLSEVEELNRRQQRWASGQPANFAHRWHAVEAELASLRHDAPQAQQYYTLAIELATQHAFLNDAATCWELLGKHHQRSGALSQAEQAFIQAQACFRACGMHAKSYRLAPHALAPMGAEAGAAGRHGPDNLDLTTIHKATRALSQEIVLPKLLTRLLDVAMENAAAQRGLLLLAVDGQWHVDSEQSMTATPHTDGTTHHSKLEEYGNERLATALVHYLSRTKTSLIINNAAADPLLRQDRYVKRAQVRSLLLIPILHQTDLIGLLYFENNALAGAFHPRRVEILEVIAAQAAISIMNARLYQEMERRVELRTEELRRQKSALEHAMAQLQSTQQQLILNEKMASVGTLTAGVAHEINNPANFSHVGAQNMLNALDRFHHLLLALLDEGPDADPVRGLIAERVEELRTQGLAVVEGTTRIRDLVRDLRTFSRVDEAEHKLAAIGDNLVATVNLVRTQYASIANIECAILANPILACRPAQLNQVFMNLIINACQAIESRQAGPDRLPFGSVRISTRLHQGQLVITFADNGCGMPAEVQQRIFEPFFTTKAVGNGTGLGLSIGFQIIAGHGGHIAVSSLPGAGATLTISLPLPAGPPPQS